MIVLIRHGNDEDTEQTHQHDWHLNANHYRDISKLGRKIKKRWGIPNYIVASKFRRALLTARLLRGEDRIKIHKSSKAGRYFTSKNKRNPDVAKETYKLGIIIEETKDEFKERLQRLCDKLAREKDGQVIWVITHAYCFKRIARYFGYIPNQRIDFLEYLLIA